MAGAAPRPAPARPHVVVRGLTMAYGPRVIMNDLDFSIARGEVFVIMGGSGSGKSTLLRHLIGLLEPAKGEILYEEQNFTRASPEAYTGLGPAQIREVAALKLALVGLAGFEDYYPSEISGGMQKRAGLARAMALDPEILYFDEPSAGLDPISSRLLDDLILELRASLGATIVVVTHELASIFAIATRCVFLDADTKRMIATGPPRELLESGDEKVRRFLLRGEIEAKKEFRP